MALAVTSAPSTELLTVEEAKRHLRILSGDLDDEVASLIRAARDWCEWHTNRTFRLAVTRTDKRNEWWCDELKPPYPPLLGVTSIAYYDEDNATQTLSAANYHVELSTHGGGRIVWADDADIPSLYVRPDAITVTFTTGYASLDTLPPSALQAMKTKLTELWGSGTEGEIRAAIQATNNLLAPHDWTGYA
jgi:uncharacterized phiE125 gp8 family phage protein